MASINLAGSIGLPANAAILGTVTINFPTNASVTMTAAQWSNRFISLTSTSGLSGPQNLIAPLIQGIEFVIQNNTTGGQAITVVGATGAGVSIPDGYMVSVACDGSNYLQIGGISVSSGTFTAAGDLSGSSIYQTVTGLQGNPVQAQTLTSIDDGYVLTWESPGVWKAVPSVPGITFSGDITGTPTAQTVTGLQGNPIASGTLTTTNAYDNLDWNGTEWIATQPVDGQIIGQNLVSKSWATCVDDAVVINAWITQQTTIGGGRIGTLRLVNPVLKSPINLVPFSNQYSKIILYGQVRYALNNAEFLMPTGLTISGEGGGGGATLGNIGGPSVRMVGYNSSNTTTQELNNSSTDGYVGNYQYMWLCYGLNTLPASTVGQILTVTAVGSGTGASAFIGTYIIAAVQSTGVVRLVFQGPGSVPTYLDNANTCTWSTPGYSGTNLTFTSDSQPIPVLPVYQTKNLTNNSYLHWMSLSNCSNSDLKTKIHRIMGIASSTTAYVCGWNLNQAHTLSLPDYGTGGSSPGSATVHVYEAFPLFRMMNYNTVSNISAFNNQSPVFVMDGTDAVTQECSIYNCNTGQDGTTSAPAYVSVINDGCFEFYIRNCIFSAYSTNNQPATILLTGTNGTQEAEQPYDGIGRIEDCLLSWYGVVVRQESGFAGTTSNRFTNVLIDLVLDYPGLTWNALTVIDGGAPFLQFTDCSPADASGVYLVEALTTSFTNLGLTAIQLQNIVVDNSAINSGYSIIFGPNIAGLGVDLITIGQVLSNLTPTTNVLTQYSSSYLGYVDNAEFDRNADFSPVMQLPFQLTLPPLLTVANWAALPSSGTITASSTGADGYNLFGPDMSQGKVIRLHATGSGGSYTVYSGNLSSPQVGDVLLTFIPVRDSSTASNTGIDSANLFTYTPGYTTFGGSENSYVPNITTVAINMAWQNVIGYHVVKNATTGLVPFQFQINPTVGNDLVVDPESIALCYIPASSPNTEAIPIAEIVRQYRKKGGQITGATPGDVAVPTRTGLSFGGLGPRVSSDTTYGNLVLTSGTNGRVHVRNPNYHTVITTSTYQVVSGNYLVGIGAISNSIAIIMPAAPQTGDNYLIKDVDGYCGSAIYVVISGNGYNIDGYSIIGITNAYNAYGLQFTGSQWSIVSAYNKNTDLTNLDVNLPFIAGINIDFASANGGESRTIRGFNLSGATVTVDGQSATVTSTTATTVTFTVPASTVSSTNGNSSVSVVAVTTAFGTFTTNGSPGNSLWYIPTYFGIANCGVWSAQNVTLSGSNIATVVDNTGNGYTLTPSDANVPTYSATGGGSGGTLPYWSVLSATGYRLTNTSMTVSLPFEWAIAVRSTASGVVNMVDFTPTGNRSCVKLYGGKWNQYSSNASDVNGVTFNSGSDQYLLSYFDNSTASQQVLNGAAAVTGSNPGNMIGTANPIVGGYGTTGNFSAVGRYYFIAIYGGGLTSTGRTNINAYFLNQGL